MDHGPSFAQLGRPAAPIARAIGDLLKPLPSRFRDYLGNICESHHKDDLEDRTKYPLFAVVGDHDKETVNVQYAAILLRTTDLLHITKDRTPSVAYQTIGFSDPMGVSE
jgi:molecular chaperone HtpG